MRSIKDHSLYLVISEECCMGKNPVEIAELAIAGGVDIVQMREKNKSLQELVKLGTDLAAVCKSKGAMFIVNDDPMLAQRVGADGVHLGQEDMDRFPLTRARDILGHEKTVGISTTSRAQFDKANALGEDVDYIAFGPIFPTTLKDHHIGTDDIEYVMKTARRPVFFIGGINLANIDEILSRGGRNIAVIRAITESGDIRAGSRRLKDKIDGG
jgi:thiamine-phosphate pyrophosphorylase